jgi:hypothetical protein
MGTKPVSSASTMGPDPELAPDAGSGTFSIGSVISTIGRPSSFWSYIAFRSMSFCTSTDTYLTLPVALYYGTRQRIYIAE